MEKIVITSNSPKEDVQKALYYGCFYHVIKDVDFKNDNILGLYCSDYIKDSKEARKNRTREILDALDRIPASTLDEILFKWEKRISILYGEPHNSVEIIVMELAEAQRLIKMLKPFMSEKHKTFLVREVGSKVGEIDDSDITQAVKDVLFEKFNESNKILLPLFSEEIGSLDERWLEFRKEKYKEDNELPFPVYRRMEYIDYRLNNLDIEYLDLMLNALSNSVWVKAKVGRPMTKGKLAQLAEKIAYTIIFDRHLKHATITSEVIATGILSEDFAYMPQESVSLSIEEVRLTNGECRIIYDTLDSFQLLKEHDREYGTYGDDVNLYGNYIRKLIDDYRKSTKAQNPYEHYKVTERILNAMTFALLNHDLTLDIKYPIIKNVVSIFETYRDSIRLSDNY